MMTTYGMDGDGNVSPVHTGPGALDAYAEQMPTPEACAEAGHVFCTCPDGPTARAAFGGLTMDDIR
ncbi:hypothetical protein GCM10018962_77290 [Dactylosporangium matsuzakiense]|uniref:hypothetical protein n=1 Tax=Dactylosporangium matsuzakiense TaxID=53360 RepID=UPI0031EDD051